MNAFIAGHITHGLWAKVWDYELHNLFEIKELGPKKKKKKKKKMKLKNWKDYLVSVNLIFISNE